MDGASVPSQGIYTNKSTESPQTPVQYPTLNLRYLANQPASTTRRIDWLNLNYPKWLRIIHYDPNELSSETRGIAIRLHKTFLIACATLSINLFHTIILALCGVYPINVIYSFLQLPILVPLFGYAFYQGYCCLAMSSSSYTLRYLMVQALVILLSFLLIFIPFGPINGFTLFPKLGALHVALKLSAGVSYFWAYAILVESLMWGVELVFATWNLFKVWYNCPLPGHALSYAGTVSPVGLSLNI